MKFTTFISIFLLSTLYSSISFSAKDNSNFKKVDPDSIDPKMTIVMYHLTPKELAIASYRQGSPSHFKVKLCPECNEKTYQLSKKVQLVHNQQPLKKNDLAMIVMEKKYKHITLIINRSEQSIDFLAFNTVKKLEFEPSNDDVFKYLESQ